MREVAELDHLKALPLCAVVRTKDGKLRERIETGVWIQIGTDHAVEWNDEDFPATVIWDYAEEINDPSLVALARLATGLLKTQAQKEAQMELAQLFAKHAEQQQQDQAAPQEPQPAQVAPNGAPSPQPDPAQG